MNETKSPNPEIQAPAGQRFSGLDCSTILDVGEIKESECDGCMALQAANLALRDDVRRLVGLLLAVRFLAYQTSEVRDFIHALSNETSAGTEPAPTDTDNEN